MRYNKNMGWGTNYLVYRWWTDNRQNEGYGGGGDDGGGGAFVLFLLALFGIVMLILALYNGIRIIWMAIYGVINPVLSIYPPVMTPLLFTGIIILSTKLIGPYNTTNAKKAIDGVDGDKPRFVTKVTIGIIALNIVFALFVASLHPRGPYTALTFLAGFGDLGIAIGLLIISIMMLPLLLISFVSIYYLPYMYARLLLRIRSGIIYVIAILTPAFLPTFADLFDVELGSPINQLIYTPSEEIYTDGMIYPPDLLAYSVQGSDFYVLITSLLIFNLTYIGGATVVILKQDEIRDSYQPQPNPSGETDDKKPNNSP